MKIRMKRSQQLVTPNPITKKKVDRKDPKRHPKYKDLLKGQVYTVTEEEAARLTDFVEV